MPELAEGSRGRASPRRSDSQASFPGAAEESLRLSICSGVNRASALSRRREPWYSTATPISVLNLCGFDAALMSFSPKSEM